VPAILLQLALTLHFLAVQLSFVFKLQLLVHVVPQVQNVMDKVSQVYRVVVPRLVVVLLRVQLSYLSLNLVEETDGRNLEQER
jgi:hypothetical protein